MDRRPRVIIIGAGFGGLYTARTLERAPVDVLLIDRHNFHTFTPLLYQVATSGLEPAEIGYPVRGIFRAESNISFLMGEVTAINRDQKYVAVTSDGETRHEHFDYLVVAAGSVTNYFNLTDAAQHAFELKTLHDAVALRNHTLRQFEMAAWIDDESQRKALTTLVVVGGGPTGLELAGALLELYKNVLNKEYPFLRDMTPNVILVEATDTLLIPFPQPLQKSALRQLQSLGVQVILGNPVAETAVDHIRLKDGMVIPTYTLIWAAGVKANPIGELLGLPLHRSGRVAVKPTMEALVSDGIYIVGDMAYLEDDKAQPYPMLIPPAKQQGILAANNILRRIQGNPEKTFYYIDRGIMATIGRSRAVAWMYNRIQLSGYLAWLSWLGLHLIALLGFKNRLNVFINWVWNYLTYDRSVRLILDTPPREPVLPREIEADEPRSLQNALSESPEDRYNSEGSNRAIEDAL